METIKVNMSPNPLDVQTIHASQNDNEGREWGFELHNNGEKIDSSSISDQLVFKAYEGGTEQILPENTSTPTTSPFLGDIKYPQGLLSDQEFLYRESPTEEDGLAKITDIKGNTLNWNQLVQNGNFADGLTNWEQASATLSVSNGVCRATFTGIAWNNDIRQSVAIKSGHRYLIVCDYLMSAEFGDLVFTAIFGQSGFSVPIRNQRVKSHLASIFTSTGNITSVRFATVSSMESYSGQYYEISNVNLFDLTQMFGSGNEPSTVEEFTSLFPLPYYDYNQGTLLSFMGNGIKTVGKNQLDPSDAVGLIGTVTYSNDTYTIAYSSSGDRYVGMNFYRRGIPLDKLLPKKYTLSFNISGVSTTWAIGLRNATNNSFLNSAVVSVNSDGHYSLTIDLETNKQTEYYLSFVRTGNQTSALTVFVSNVMLEIGNTETSYEPYTSSLAELPISQYFSNGMKSAGSVYDELTPSKAYTRVGMVDLGNLEYVYDSTVPRFYTSGLANIVKNPSTSDTKGNAISDMYEVLTVNQFFAQAKDKTMMVATNGNMSFINTVYNSASAFKSAMSGVYLYYELATPIETEITTASLVTENAEIPLSNEDGVLIGKCTEQLSSESGFFDAKIKLADEDGECYSNKLQLHIERSPQ